MVHGDSFLLHGVDLPLCVLPQRGDPTVVRRQGIVWVPGARVVTGVCDLLWSPDDSLCGDNCGGDNI